jgi:hypothetical protein
MRPHARYGESVDGVMHERWRRPTRWLEVPIATTCPA